MWNFFDAMKSIFSIIKEIYEQIASIFKKKDKEQAEQGEYNIDFHNKKDIIKFLIFILVCLLCLGFMIFIIYILFTPK